MALVAENRPNEPNAVDTRRCNRADEVRNNRVDAINAGIQKLQSQHGSRIDRGMRERNHGDRVTTSGLRLGSKIRSIGRLVPFMANLSSPTSSSTMILNMRRSGHWWIVEAASTSSMWTKYSRALPSPSLQQMPNPLRLQTGAMSLIVAQPLLTAKPRKVKARKFTGFTRTLTCPSCQLMN